MSILNDFIYLKPKTLKEATGYLSKHKNSQLLAGGTDLVGLMKEGHIQPCHIIDLKNLKDLKKITKKETKITLGSLVTFSDIIESNAIQKKFPILVEIAKKVASVGIRNRATMVGNICSAVPCMDSGPIMMALEGVVHLKSSRGSRNVKAKDWFVSSRTTSRKPQEIVTGITLTFPNEKYSACYNKLGRYRGEDLAQMSLITFKTKKNQYLIAYGSVGPTPIRAKKIEALLNGKKLTSELLEQAKALVAHEISPITDIRATREYRLHMSEVFLERSLNALEVPK